MSNDVIKVGIVDDDAMIRNILSKLLGMEEGLEIVGTASDGDKAIELVEQVSPDVLLMDVQMERVNGIDACKLVKEQFPELAIIMLTTFDQADYLSDAIAVNAQGFLTKDTEPAMIASSIRAAHAGQPVFSAGPAKRMMDRYSGLRTSGAAQAVSILDGLTKQEISVLRYLALAMNNSEIAREMLVGEATIKSHMTSIFRKIGVRDRTEAVVFVYQNNLFPLDD